MDYKERDAHVLGLGEPASTIPAKVTGVEDARNMGQATFGGKLVDSITQADTYMKRVGMARERAMEHVEKTKGLVDKVRTLETRVRECDHMVILLDKYIKGGWHAPEVRVQPGMGSNQKPEEHQVVKVQAKFMLEAVTAQVAEYREALDDAVAKLLGHGYGAPQ